MGRVRKAIFDIMQDTRYKPKILYKDRNLE